ncbi:MAG: hypothetical protein ABSE46_17975 [Terracidiphilus sp.]
MNGRIVVAGILTFAFVGVGTAQGAVGAGGDDSHVSQGQLKRMAREAHTPEQYKALAVSYEVAQKDYLKQAAEAKQEWIRLTPITGSLYAKYPRPADSAKNLYECDVEKASRAGALSQKYAQLAEPAGNATQQQM